MVPVYVSEGPDCGLDAVIRNDGCFECSVVLDILDVLNEGFRAQTRAEARFAASGVCPPPCWDRCF